MARSIPGPDLSSHPDPAPSYEEAVLTVDAFWDVEEREPLAPEGPSIAMLTGERTPKAVVLFHGYTTVPRQFRLIAQGFRDAGCNVWVPRMPFHGLPDRLTGAPSALTAPMLRDHADRAIDVARGLGDSVTVVGLSGGGSLATWCATARDDVDETVAISPLMKPLGFPAWAVRLLVSTMPHVPDHYDWWYPKLKQELAGYQYPRFSYKGIAAFLQLVYWCEDEARRRPYPVRGRYTLVRNDGEDRLDSTFNERLVRTLVAPERLSVYGIEAADGLKHDIVTPDAFSDNAASLGVAYEHLSRALGIELPDPTRLDEADMEFAAFERTAPLV